MKQQKRKRKREFFVDHRNYYCNESEEEKRDELENGAGDGFDDDRQNIKSEYEKYIKEFQVKEELCVKMKIGDESVCSKLLKAVQKNINFAPVALGCINSMRIKLKKDREEHEKYCDNIRKELNKYKIYRDF